MGQLGIVARIALIVTVALFLSQLAVVLPYLWQSEKSQLPPRAIAERIFVIVRLLDETPAANRVEALAVANVNGFEVSVAPALPTGFEDDFSFTRVRLIAQSNIDAYAPGRIVRAGTIDTRKHSSGDFTITFVVDLKSGEKAIFTVSDNTTLRVWELPIGFLAGFFGIAVALIAVIAVARETRPLARLARTVDDLGNRAEPVRVRETGARELRTLIRAINNMQERIFGLVANRTVFLGAISHDLKTYLTRFRLRLEMMPESTHRERAIRDVEAMQQILNDSLLFASETSPDPAAEITDLGDTVERCAVDTDMQGGAVTVTAIAPSLKVRMPARALSRVIDNLLSNALLYGKRARVSVELQETTARIIVDDDGPGIPPQDIALVFEPFYRSEPSRSRAHGGTGLGLSIVRQILDAHGGVVTLQNRPGGGLRAIVRLPLAD